MDQVRRSAKRLERYAIRSREKIWKGDYIGALADLAEAGEIARRLWHSLAAASRSETNSKSQPSD